LLKSWQAGHGGFDGEGDSLFCLQWRETCGTRVDLHLDVCNVGYCVDRKFLIAGDAEASHEKNREQHDDALLDCKLDQAFEHKNLLVEMADQWECSAEALPSSDFRMKLPAAAT